MSDQPTQTPYYPPPPEPRRTRSFLLPLSFTIGCLPWLVLGLVFLVFIAGSGGGEKSKTHVALIRVSGVITAGRTGSSFLGGSVTGSEDIVEQLEDARENDSAKAIVIRINSPGGSPAGSEEIYNAIRRMHKEKPVYVSMGDVAASGGYYVASACDKIYADDSSITGSIGVILETSDMSQLFRKIGLSPEVIKSGKYKDIGSPNRPLTPEEKKLLQAIVDATYKSFVEAVARGRGMSFDQVKALADGRIFTGSQALKLKLVDEIGGLHETVTAAGTAAGIKEKPDVVEYRKAGWFESILGAEESSEISRRVGDAVVKRLLDRVVSEDSSPSGLR